MKKIFLLLILFVSCSTYLTYAESTYVEVRVVEKVPGVNCTIEEGSGEKNEDGTINPTIYICQVPKGTAGVTNMLGEIIKYFTFIAGLTGVMFIVYSGILYSMGGADQSLKDVAKKRIQQTLIGIILLLLSGYILQFLAGWVFK